MITGVDHVGIVVANLDAAEKFVSGTLGLTPTQRISLPDRSTEIVFFDCAGVQLELVEVTDPQSRAVRLGPEGTVARIEHIALGVENLELVVQALAGQGVSFTAGADSTEESAVPLEVAGTRSLFSRPDTSAGLLVQLIERLQA